MKKLILIFFILSSFLSKGQVEFNFTDTLSVTTVQVIGLEGTTEIEQVVLYNIFPVITKDKIILSYEKHNRTTEGDLISISNFEYEISSNYANLDVTIPYQGTNYTYKMYEWFLLQYSTNFGLIISKEIHSLVYQYYQNNTD